ncbi:MAG: DUF4381 family protein [Verrucomicrobiales bacterium]
MVHLSQQSQPLDDIYDIVVLQPKEPTWPVVLTAVLFLVFVLALALGAWVFFRRRRNRTFSESAEARAAKRLRQLERDHIELDANRFTLSLSETLKDYLSEKFDDPVRFETTQEFLGRIAREQSRMPEAAQQELRGFLVAGEELKFGHAPDASRKTWPLLKTANRIVDLCRTIGDDSRNP